MGKEVKDLIGRKFGRLTVISCKGKANNGKYQWECICDCGKIVTVKGNSLTTGHTKSCGCFELETKKSVNTTHGLRHHPLYHVWLNMKHRCYNLKDSHYIYYGGKGIVVCDEWLNSFEAFYNWSINNGYSKGMSIDRIDNSLNYCPTNCRYIPIEKQSSNRTTNHKILYKDKIYTIAELSRLLNIKSSTLYSQIRRNGRINILL